MTFLFCASYRHIAIRRSRVHLNASTPNKVLFKTKYIDYSIEGVIDGGITSSTSIYSTPCFAKVDYDCPLYVG